MRFCRTSTRCKSKVRLSPPGLLLLGQSALTKAFAVWIITLFLPSSGTFLLQMEEFSALWHTSHKTIQERRQIRSLPFLKKQERLSQQNRHKRYIINMDQTWAILNFLFIWLLNIFNQPGRETVLKIEKSCIAKRKKIIWKLKCHRWPKINFSLTNSISQVLQKAT